MPRANGSAIAGAGITITTSLASAAATLAACSGSDGSPVSGATVQLSGCRDTAITSDERRIRTERRSPRRPHSGSAARWIRARARARDDLARSPRRNHSQTCPWRPF